MEHKLQMAGRTAAARDRKTKPQGEEGQAEEQGQAEKG